MTDATPEVARDATVEAVARAMYDASHRHMRNCYSWDDEWEPHQEPGRARYLKEATAALAAARPLIVSEVVERCAKRAVGAIGAVVLEQKACGWLGWSSVTPETRMRRLAESIDAAIRALSVGER